MTGSPFYPKPVPIGDPIPIRKAEDNKPFPAGTSQGGPTKVELEDWYYELDNLSHELKGRARERVLDLRDELYKHLH